MLISFPFFLHFLFFHIFTKKNRIANFSSNNTLFSFFIVFLSSVMLRTIDRIVMLRTGFAPIFPDTCYHLTHYWPAAADIPVASDNPVHYADAIRYNARTPLQGSLLPLTRLV